MEYTTNYHLPQWQESDRILMEDFNRMCADMEAGLEEVKNIAAEELNGLAESVSASLGNGGQNCRITWGSYTGDGTYGPSSPTTLTTGFVPILAIILNLESAGNDPAILMHGFSQGRNDQGKLSLNLIWGDSGLSWYTTNTLANDPAAIQMNASGQTYQYIVFGYSAS